MKKYLFFATALVALASCSNNDYIGEQPPVSSQSESGAIKFGTGLSAVTRADHVGADAAGKLNNKFIVGGFKGTYTDGQDLTNVTPATGTVFDNYIVQWNQNTAGTTASNTSDWEYVGISVAQPSALYADGTDVKQTIKYWDYGTTQYDFIAYSTGNATIATSGTAADAITANKVLVTKIDPANATTNAYQLSGKAADLAKCYIADMVTVYKSSNNYGKEVPLTFRNLASKVRMAIYETVPGYSVKDVKFYTDASTGINHAADASTVVDNATLFTTNSTTKDNFYTAGTYTVKFPNIGRNNMSNSDYNKAHVSFTDNAHQSTKDFGSLNLVGKDYKETDVTNYIGRTSATASFAGTASPDHYYQIALPNEEGTVLELRVDYTLLSIDGSGEEIKVHGAKAYVPAIYAAWKSNYAYTYIFKISDNTNGWTSTVDTDPAGLYPITFDAVVVDSEDNTQSTITTVASPSITTYQKGHDISKDEYLASGGDIYVQVMNDGGLATNLATSGISSLYSLSSGTWTEADVMDALNIVASGTTGRNGLTLTDVSSTASFANDITTIPGADGNNITVTSGTAAKFTPTAGTTYAYVYYTGTDKADTYYHTAVVLYSAPEHWPTIYNNYYTDEACTVTAPTTFPTLGEGESVTYYQKYTNLNKVYGVKVIKVVSGS